MATRDCWQPEKGIRPGSAVPSIGQPRLAGPGPSESRASPETWLLGKRKTGPPALRRNSGAGSRGLTDLPPCKDRHAVGSIRPRGASSRHAFARSGLPSRPCGAGIGYRGVPSPHVGRRIPWNGTIMLKNIMFKCITQGTPSPRSAGPPLTGIMPCSDAIRPIQRPEPRWQESSERSRILPPRPTKLGWGEGKQGFKHGDGVPRARTLTRRSSVGGLSALRALRVRPCRRARDRGRRPHLRSSQLKPPRRACRRLGPIGRRLHRQPWMQALVSKR